MHDLEPNSQDDVFGQFKMFEFTNLSTIKGSGKTLTDTSSSKEEAFDKDSAFSTENWEYYSGY